MVAPGSDMILAFRSAVEVEPQCFCWTRH